MTTTTKEKPILFSAPMVRAILDGRKTMTRRIVKPQPPSIEQVTQQSGSGFSIFTDEHDPGEFRVAGPVWCVRESMGREPKWKCPYGSPGSHLWVREAHMRIPEHRLHQPHYTADGPRPSISERHDAGLLRSYPSIFMPRWASRITLQVEAVRVERLQEITEADALSEGVASGRQRESTWYEGKAVEMFRDLWGKINGPESWDANPFVWCVSFIVVKP